MTTPIVFLDTETTGLGPDREPWEIAMIRREYGQHPADSVQRSISFFVYVDLSQADPMALKFSRFYERHPSFDGPKANWIDEPDGTKGLEPPYATRRFEAARLVHDWTRGAHIVGAVPNFDTEMLDRVLRESRLVPAWHYHLIDVENLAVGYLSGRDPKTDFWTPPWNSDELSTFCGVEPPSSELRHTAMGDAEWAMRWYDKIMTGGAA